MKSTFIVLALTGLSFASCSKLNPNPSNVGDEVYVKTNDGRTISHSAYLEEMEIQNAGTLAPQMGWISCWVNVNGVPRQGQMCTQSTTNDCSAYTYCITK